MLLPLPPLPAAASGVGVHLHAAQYLPGPVQRCDRFVTPGPRPQDVVASVAAWDHCQPPVQWGGSVVGLGVWEDWFHLRDAPPGVYALGPYGKESLSGSSPLPPLPPLLPQKHFLPHLYPSADNTPRLSSSRSISPRLPTTSKLPPLPPTPSFTVVAPKPMAPSLLKPPPPPLSLLLPSSSVVVIAAHGGVSRLSFAGSSGTSASVAATVRRRCLCPPLSPPPCCWGICCICPVGQSSRTCRTFAVRYRCCCQTCNVTTLVACSCDLTADATRAGEGWRSRPALSSDVKFLWSLSPLHSPLLLLHLPPLSSPPL